MIRLFFHLSLALIAGLSLASCSQDTKEGKASRYAYETVDGDPLEAKLYTLDNGLKLYISVNPEEPRVSTQIAVRTGSKQDPSDATGLAHYLEHMLFKGTSLIGTKDWEEESRLLKEISDQYELHRSATDPEERKAIYSVIDSLSSLAASFAISNEYDKMISSLGARGTNAYTSVEQTVYINDIPANELEKWAAVEAERFRELVLRLFHTELEVVYEEFNRGQDSDFRRAYYAMMEEIFPSHPYGTQTTIGTSEHLKTPSMEKIHEYFLKHYVPGNMAIVIAGDVKPDEVVEIIERHFGEWEARKVPSFDAPEEAPMESPVVREVQGVDAEFVMMGYRLPGAGTREAVMLGVMDGILSNGKAGLIDLNLEQKQKVLSAFSSPIVMNDYSILRLQGNPRRGQSLDEVAALLREQIEIIKAGDFPDWMLEAVINNMKLRQLRQLESNWARAAKMTSAFVSFRDWEDVVSTFDVMDSFSKDDIVAFANEWFGDNYVQINKLSGENTAVKVDKPQITPIEIDREAKSTFYARWDSIEGQRLEPQFLDYDKLIDRTTFTEGVEMYSIANKSNELFSLYYILDMGSDNDLLTSLAVDYLPYLGTSRYTAEELAQEFFKLGLDFDVFSSRDRLYVSLAGLNSSLEEGLELFEHILADVESDEQALNDLIEGILKRRKDALKNKNQLLYNGLMNYAQYGPENPTKHKLSQEDLLAVSAEDLTERIKKITSFRHDIFYYGPQKMKEVKNLLAEHHELPEELLDYPNPRLFEEQAIDESKVYFAHFDMVQSEMMLLSKGPLFQPGLMAPAAMFNSYFGSGLSSVVFQEIRESKALAYSAYSVFTSPDRIDKSHYVRAYIGAQVDKLPEACDAMLALMNEMPHSEIQFEAARDAALKQIESSRITRQSIFWNYRTAQRRGLDYDIRRENYEVLQNMNFEQLNAFFEQFIAGSEYNYLVIGNENLMDFEVLEQLGPLQKLTHVDLFGYDEKDLELPAASVHVIAD